MLDKQHLSREGLNRIVGIKANFKRGLSTLLKEGFPNYIPYGLPLYTPNLDLINMGWLIGFINADGSFASKKINKRNLTAVTGNIQITQHADSLKILQAIQKLLGFGALRYVKETNA